MSGNEHPIMAALRRQHPSDRLRQGPCAGFEDALELLVQEHAYEHDRLVRSLPDPADMVHSEQALAQVRAATRHAGQVYREEQEAARRRTVARLRVTAYDLQGAAGSMTPEVEWLGLLAEGLDAGDYSGLAI